MNSRTKSGTIAPLAFDTTTLRFSDRTTLNRKFDSRLKAFADSEAARRIRHGRTGIEKESLRVTPEGYIANTPHPRALGSALTHPYITTDYSEALLEFITPPFTRLDDTLTFLQQVHQFTYRNIDDELLWATSMPCMVGGEDSIPIANYGSSNVGHMKHIYRRGLSHRYGRLMQIISGVHFNYSLPDRFWAPYQEAEADTRSRREFVSAGYFAIIRNFQRLGWVIPYLFGSSPAVCKSFIKARHKEITEFDPSTLYRPYATSLRMSDIGYKNQNQSDLRVSYENLKSYVSDLNRVIHTPHAEYEKIGVKVDNDYRQLNSNVLQIENEYYSFIRPKQIARSGERPTLALRRRGVRYVEVRALDVNPFDPLGVNHEQLRFIEAFLILCLLLDSPPVSDDELDDINKNQQLVACCGRDPKLRLRINGEARPVGDLVDQICTNLEVICALLDGNGKSSLYRDAVTRQREVANDPDALPSTRVLEELRNNKESFFEFAMRMSQAHRDLFQSMPLDPEKTQMFEEEAARSIALQATIERADNMSFDEYLRRYFSDSTVDREAVLG